jgi:predicted RNA binding protein YcfA (HicA-like mRNA interferase family)
MIVEPLGRSPTLRPRTVAASSARSIFSLTLFDVVCIHTHMNSRDIITAIKADGWRQVDQKGSHVQFEHPTKPGRVIVPHPRRDIPRGTMRSIEKQAGIKLK